MIRSGEHAIWDARMSNIRFAVIVATMPSFTKIARDMERALTVTIKARAAEWEAAMKEISAALLTIQSGGSAAGGTTSRHAGGSGDGA